MPKNARLVWILAAVLVVGALAVWNLSAGSCTGTYYTYYDSPAHTNIVGAKVVCPGYPDQIDYNADGTYTQTAYYTTETVICPCPSGGGGGGGGCANGECEDSEAP